MSVYVLAVSIVLAVIALTVSIGIGAYFTYKYIKSNKENVSKYDYASQAKNYYTFFFINNQKFKPSLLKSLIC